MYILLPGDKIRKTLGYSRLGRDEHDRRTLVGPLAAPFDTTNPRPIVTLLHITLQSY
jgi:hypothetical protein